MKADAGGLLLTLFYLAVGIQFTIEAYVRPSSTVNAVFSGATLDRVISRPATDDIAILPPSIIGIVTGAPVNKIVVWDSEEYIIPGLTLDHIVVWPTVNGVIMPAALNSIHAGASANNVIAKKGPITA